MQTVFITENYVIHFYTDLNVIYTHSFIYQINILHKNGKKQKEISPKMLNKKIFKNKIK